LKTNPKLRHRTISLGYRPPDHGRALSAGFWLMLLLLISTTAQAGPPNYKGYLGGESSSIETRSPLGFGPNVTRWWDYRRFPTAPGHLFVCIAYSKRFRPEIWIEHLNKRDAITAKRGSEKNDDFFRHGDNNEWFGAKVQFHTRKDSPVVLINVSSYWEDGCCPEGSYWVKCKELSPNHTGSLTPVSPPVKHPPNSIDGDRRKCKRWEWQTRTTKVPAEDKKTRAEVKSAQGGTVTGWTNGPGPHWTNIMFKCPIGSNWNNSTLEDIKNNRWPNCEKTERVKICVDWY
jgi:hypothetical protein